MPLQLIGDSNIISLNRHTSLNRHFGVDCLTTIVAVNHFLFVGCNRCCRSICLGLLLLEFVDH